MKRRAPSKISYYDIKVLSCKASVGKVMGTQWTLEMLALSSHTGGCQVNL